LWLKNFEASMEELTGREIAVIGMAGRFPGARNLSEFWQNLRNGVETVTFFTEEELLASGVEPETIRHPNYVPAGSLLEDVELFDASFFGYNAREAEILDPQQRLFLEVTWHALEDAGYDPQQYEGLIGVYAGAAWNTYLLSNLTTHLELFDGGGAFQVFIASDKDFMPTRVAYKFNLKGPGLIIQTSCSTSLVAVHLACLSLLNYECDIALAGGVTVKVPQKAGYFYQEGGLASPDGHCRAFDANAAGTIFGSGVGVVALKRLSEALSDGDHIRAVVKASAINNDGSAKVSYTAPSVDGQSQVVAAAQAMAGIEPETIRYIETHGTGTSLGDPIEVTALTKIFRKSTQRKSFCAIGSLKSNIGHLDAAAGVGGFIKTVLALENREIPPSINFEAPNPAIDFPETPFYVNSKLTPWETQDVPRRAAVSSFGVGGTNAHVILEAAPAPTPSGASRPWQLLPLSARTATALETATENLLTWLREHPEANFPDVAYTLKVGRTVFRHRRFLVCRDRDDAVNALEAPARVRLLTGIDAEEPRDRPIVFMFPGQGSQYLYQAHKLYEGEPTFRKHFDECERLLEPHLGLELSDVLYGPTDDEASARIEQTSLTQPILFVTEYALANLWMSWDVRPSAMLGHSIGEYVAACLAGVFSLEDALRLVAVRGRLMQQQPAGRMMSVALPEEELSHLLPAGISVAAVNEPSSCVVSGSLESMAKLQEELARREIGFRYLHTSHAFHSPMMEPLLDAFTSEVQQVRLQAPRIPFVSGLTGTWITAQEATDAHYWARQLRQTVRFSQGLRELLSDPERVFVEVGPGRTLTTLATRHTEGRGRVLVPSLRHVKEETPDTALILESVGRLWTAGVKIDWSRFYANEQRRRLPLQPYPFERQRFWIEPRTRTIGGVGQGSEESATVKKVNLSDWFYLPSWKPSLLPRPVEELRNNWLVLTDEGGFGEALATRLSALAHQVFTVRMGERFSRQGETSYTIRPGSVDDHKQLFEDLKAREWMPQAIVHAFSLTAASNKGVAEFERAQETGFYSLLSLLQALSLHSNEDVEISVVSNSVVATTAGEILSPEKSTMLGLCKVAPQELSYITTRLIDVPPPDPAASSHLLDTLMSELNTRHVDEVVAYRGRHSVPGRYVQSFEPAHPDGSLSAPLREQGVYFITGGLSGNGFSIAKYLARTIKARLVLVEREPLTEVTGDSSNGHQLPNSSAGDDPRLKRLATLNELGADVCLVVADVADETQLARAWSEGETRFGVIHGVIHAEEPSGERAFRALLEADREDCAWHFRSKAHALYGLEKLLKNKEIDFCVLLSSVASVLGGVGYGPYVAANLFMDAFVRSSNQTNSSPWLSLNCDLWLSDDGHEQLTDLRADLSELAMATREGEEVFRQALATRGVDQLLVSTVDLPARLLATQRRFQGLRERQKTGSGPTAEINRHERPPLSTPYVAPESEIEQRIAAVWQQVLGFEQIGVEDNFFELGGDSLVAIQVASSLKQALNMDFPVAKLYQAVTVRSLAQVLSETEDEEQQRRAAEQAERNQATARRMQYIEHRRARVRAAE
jgi:acyl transferase domain-containing protein